MNDRIFKYIRWFKYLLFGAGGLSFVVLLVMANIFPEPSLEFVGSAGAAKGVDIMLWFAFAILAVAVLSAIGFAAADIAGNPKADRTTVISFGALAVLFGVCWLLSSDEPISKTVGGFFDNGPTLRWVDTGLYVGYAALAIAVGIIIFCEVRGSVMKRQNRRGKDAEG